jgi:hypothetical protein
MKRGVPGKSATTRNWNRSRQSRSIQLHERKLMNADKLEKLCRAYLGAKNRSEKVDAFIALIDFVAALTRSASAVHMAMRESESKGKN